MNINNLLAFGRASEERALISLGIGIGSILLVACSVKICMCWANRRSRAITDYAHNYSHYGSNGLMDRVQNFRRDSETMPAQTPPESNFFEIPISPISSPGISPDDAS